MLSELVLQKTLDETDDWLSLFFLPVELELQIASDWLSVVDPTTPMLSESPHTP